MEAVIKDRRNNQFIPPFLLFQACILRLTEGALKQGYRRLP
ncbi:MAG: hypothetical protein ACI9G5_001775, partial [Paracoccaceae bacterium]